MLQLDTKKTYLLLIIVALVNYLLSTLTGQEFYFCIKPFIYIGLTIIIYSFTYSKYQVKKYKKFINLITIFGAITYILLYILSGIVFKFANNPLKMEGLNIIYNILYYIPSALSIELIRYRITNSLKNNNKLKNIIILNILLSLLMSNITITNFTTIKGSIETFYQTLVPNFVIGCYLSYVSIYGSLYACIIYSLTPIIYTLLSPIIPNPEWIIIVILETIIPIICYSFIEKTIPKENKLEQQKSTIPYYITIIFLTSIILFSTGIFSIYPVAIASNSMNPTFTRGDIQIINKKKQEYEKGDIIQFYGLNNTIFVHRIVSKRKEDGKTYYITKGDNNNNVDLVEISEDKIIGKAIFTIKYLGYPTIWISELF